MSIPFGRIGLWFKLFSPSFYPERAKRHLAHLIGTIGPHGLVVDLGGGTGVLLNLAHAVRTDLTYVCADPALGMLRYVSGHAYRVAAQGEDLPFGDATVDAIMIGDAIHHFTDPDKAIEEVRRTLKPGGKLFVFDIDPETAMGRVVVGLERLLGEPAHFRSPARLQDSLTQKGFDLLTKTRGMRYTLEAQKPAPSRPT